MLLTVLAPANWSCFMFGQVLRVHFWALLEQTFYRHVAQTKASKQHMVTYWWLYFLPSTTHPNQKCEK